MLIVTGGLMVLAEDSQEVSVSVSSYASVSWGDGSYSISPKMPGASWSSDNWTTIPLTIESNYDVTVSIYEGLSKLINNNAGIPYWAMFGHSSAPRYEPIAPGLRVLEPGQASRDAAENLKIDWASASAQASLPGGGRGLKIPVDLTYGGSVSAHDGNSNPPSYSGSITLPVVVEFKLLDKTDGGYSWYSLPDDFGGTFDMTATVNPLS